GVVTTDLGTRGTLDASAATPVDNCAGTGLGGKLAAFNSGIDDDFLIDLRGPNGTRRRNFTVDDLPGELAQLTNPTLSNTTCGISQPLEAMRRALDPAINPNFIRPDAMLSIVFLATKDDCS